VGFEVKGMTTKITDVSGTRTAFSLIPEIRRFHGVLCKGKAPLATNTHYSLFFQLASIENIIVASLGAFAKLRKSTISFVMSVRPSVGMERLGPTGRIFMKLDI
jgi:hypothetical protein